MTKYTILFFTLLFTCTSVFSQLLNCPLGLTNAGAELVVNGDFSAGNVGFTSDYIYNATSIWNPATYAITPNPNAVHPNFTNFGDHTTGTGNMMTINGSGTPNTSAWCQTITVSPNTTYSFSTWVHSLTNSSPAILQFQVNGVNLGSTFNAPLTSAGWQQFFASWASGAATTATICIINQNTALSGNDFALDDISFQACLCNPMNLQPTIQAATCVGSTNGSISVLVTGGSGSFIYSWNPTNATNAISTIGTGNYNFYVLDSIAPAASSCDTTVTYNVPTLPAIVINPSQTPTTCVGGLNGTASVAPTGGSGSYTYSWLTTPPQFTSTITGLGQGTYTVFVKDAADTTNCFQSTTINVLSGPATVLSTTTIPTSCTISSDGSATVTATGGSGAYSYSWASTPPQFTATASGLPVGLYTVYVSDNTNPLNCISTTTANVVAGNFNLSLTTNAIKAVSCVGGTDGQASVAVTGGSGNYTYSWVTIPNQFTSTASNLSIGTYTVYVGDATKSPLCLQSATVTIIQGPALVLTPSVSKNVSCNGLSDGKATVLVTNGSGNYSYSWTSSPAQFSATATNLAAGNYTVYVIDANAPSCQPSASISVTEPAILQISASVVQDATCFGSKDGKADVTATGGTIPYSYFWTPTNQTTATATGLGYGNYSVTVKDKNNCSQSTTLAIAQPLQMKVALASYHNATCDLLNGDISVNPVNGFAPFAYSWESTPPVLNSQIQNIGPGTYKVWITDANNCVASNSISIINIPPATASFTSVPTNTNDILLSHATIRFLNESTGASQYLWSFGDTYTSFLANPFHTFYESGDYTVSLISDNGYNICPDTAFMTFHIIPDGDVFVPNAFSPNGDGVNDVFFSDGEGIVQFKMVIYDRWGIELLQLNNPKDKWDGLIKGIPAPEGTYVYTLNVKLNNGQRLERSGTITLIR